MCRHGEGDWSITDARAVCAHITGPHRMTPLLWRFARLAPAPPAQLASTRASLATLRQTTPNDITPVCDDTDTSSAWTRREDHINAQRGTTQDSFTVMCDSGVQTTAGTAPEAYVEHGQPDQQPDIRHRALLVRASTPSTDCASLPASQSTDARRLHSMSVPVRNSSASAPSQQDFWRPGADTDGPHICSSPAHVWCSASSDRSWGMHNSSAESAVLGSAGRVSHSLEVVLDLDEPEQLHQRQQHAGVGISPLPCAGAGTDRDDGSIGLRGSLDAGTLMAACSDRSMSAEPQSGRTCVPWQPRRSSSCGGSVPSDAQDCMCRAASDPTHGSLLRCAVRFLRALELFWLLWRAVSGSVCDLPERALKTL